MVLGGRFPGDSDLEAGVWGSHPWRVGPLELRGRVCGRVAESRPKGQQNHRADLAFPWVSLPEPLPPSPSLATSPGSGPSIDGLFRAPRWSLSICLPLIPTSNSQWANPPLSLRPANVAGLRLETAARSYGNPPEQLTPAEELESSLRGEQNSCQVLFRRHPGKRATQGTDTPPWLPVF